jgi:hypothetical protein
MISVVLIYTALGFVFIPWFLTNKTSPLIKEKLGINIDIGKAKFNPYTFDLNIENILLKDLNEKPVLGLKKLHLDYVLLGLLDSSFLFKSLDIDSPVIYTSLNKKGKINLQNILPSSEIKENKSKSTLKLPTIILQKLNITNGYLYFNDFRKEKPFTLKLGSFNFQAHDISTREGDLNAHFFKTQVGKNGQIFWEGGMRINPLSLYGEINITNLQLPELYKYVLNDLGAKLSNGTLDLLVPYQVDLSKNLELTLNDAKLSLSNIIISDKKTNTDVINLPQIDLNGFNLKWPEQQASINKININNPSIIATLNKQKNINLLELFQTKTTQVAEKEETNSSKPWEYVLNDITINKGSIGFAHEFLQKSIKAQLSNLSLHVNNISSDTNSPIKYDLYTKLNTTTDIKLSGDMIQKTQKLNSSVELTNLRLKDYVAYVKPFINFDIKDAGIDIKANAVAILDEDLKLQLQADAQVNDLYINAKNGEKLLTWKKLNVNGINYTHLPMSLDIKEVQLEEPYIRAHISKDGTSNFANLVKKQPAPEKNDIQKDKSETLHVKLGPMKLTNGSSDFSDLSLPTPFKTHIYDLNGDFSFLDLQSTTPSTMRVQGKIDKYGYADIKGVILPFNIKKSAKLNVILKNLDLTSLTPYSGKFVGYAIENGKLSLDLNYAVDRANLKGDNKINIDTLNLGQKVESPDAVNLPLAFAIALLKDSDGQIDIDLPVTGDMNNPKFSYGSVIWRAVGNMITGIVTAPFKFLGSMIGVDGDELKSIDFDKGSYLVISTEHEKLENLQKILAKRPNIKLEISGGFDTFFDTQELQKQEFKTIINKELYTMNTDSNESKNDIYGTALKNLYIKDFKINKYDSLKKSFMIVSENDDNSTKNQKKKPELDIVSFNNQMQKEITENIKIETNKLENLANKRANSLKNELSKKYKIDETRIKTLPSKEQKAKRDRWIETTIDISM